MSLDRESSAHRYTANSSGERIVREHERAIEGAVAVPCSCLSPRESDILELIGQGYSNKRVARALGITAETVKSHVKHVFAKLDVNTRAHAVVRAHGLGLIGSVFTQPRPVIAASRSRDAAGAPAMGE